MQNLPAFSLRKILLLNAPPCFFRGITEVIFLDTTDDASSTLKAKGVGELGICGVPAAIANAIYNATGVRVRDSR